MNGVSAGIAAGAPATFTVRARDGESAGRTAVLRTAHALVETPAFMPVATQGTVKALDPGEVSGLGASILLANAYHLTLRPGIDVIERLGGLHRFIAWEGAILTDSGGYQIFSLASLRTVTDDGVTFRSHLDGSRLFLSPELVVEHQARMGVDVLMPLDECLGAAAERAQVEAAMRRTTLWAERSLVPPLPPGRLLFGIVQGGFFPDLRRAHAGRLAALGFPGYAVGGLSVGEERRVTHDIAAVSVAALPDERPRYLMGVGLPQELLRFVGMGYDLFDCVLPTRNGRNGTCFTGRGRVNLRLARFAGDDRPLDPDCACAVCRRFPIAYLRHLFAAGEMLGPRLASHHNLHFYLDLMRAAREHIARGDYAAWARERAAQIEAGEA
jgi:queuine tRNA-ribosyltransferase